LAGEGKQGEKDFKTELVFRNDINLPMGCLEPAPQHQKLRAVAIVMKKPGHCHLSSFPRCVVT
jgi:hypothetical protein